MKPETLGIGVIGAGLIGSLHCNSLRNIVKRNLLPLRLAHVADLELERAKRFQAGFGFEQASADPMAVLGDPAVDAVFVLTWTDSHPALVRSCAEHKKHVFCEKPLAFDAETAREMAAAVTGAGLVNQVGLVLRQAPVWNVLRRELAGRELGFPITLIFRDDQCFPIKGAHPSTWRKDPVRAGRGTLLEHSIHDLDLLEWMFGPVNSVRAETSSRFGISGIEDLVRVELEFASAMTGTLVSVWHDVLNRHSDRRLEVFHERSFCFVEDEFIGPIHFMRGEGPMTRMSKEEVNREFWELRGIEDPALRELSLGFGFYEDYLFCRSVIEGIPADPDFGVGVRAHVLVDACYESARTGERVSMVEAGLQREVPGGRG